MSKIPKPGLLADEEHISIHRRLLMRSRPALNASGIARPFHVEGRGETLRCGNQGQKPTCVAHACVGIVEQARLRFRRIAEQLDPDPVYARAKEIDGLPGRDGTTLEAGMQAVVDLGWLAPPRDLQYCGTWEEMKSALLANRFVLAAVEADEALYVTGRDGWWKPDGKTVGGHAMHLIGCDDDVAHHADFANSWGEDGYGFDGFVRLPQVHFERVWLYGLTWEITRADVLK